MYYIEYLLLDAGVLFVFSLSLSLSLGVSKLVIGNIPCWCVENTRTKHTTILYCLPVLYREKQRERRKSSPRKVSLSLHPPLFFVAFFAFGSWREWVVVVSRSAFVPSKKRETFVLVFRYQKEERSYFLQRATLKEHRHRPTTTTATTTTTTTR